MANLNELEDTIKYHFKERTYLTEALTHSSYVNESANKKRKYNERMEFLGDAVLSFISAEYLYKKYPDEKEGTLSQQRAQLVCSYSLSEFAKIINLNKYIIVGKGAAQSGVENNPSIMENTFEALIAAIYLDGGMDEAKKFVLRFLDLGIKNPESEFKDYKSMFQIVIQQNPDEYFNYKLVDEFGPDHDKHYVVNLYVNKNLVGHGVATSKKRAEQEAAKQALELMGINI